MYFGCFNVCRAVPLSRCIRLYDYSIIGMFLVAVKFPGCGFNGWRYTP